MRIAMASGKGGTGKTTIATNLSRVLARTRPVQYVDCDVEEPNGHLFLQPCITHTQSAGIPVPEVDMDRCTRCGACSQFCQSHAIACLGTTTLVFPELCHGCGGCARVCPVQAIHEVERPIGVIEQGIARGNLLLPGTAERRGNDEPCAYPHAAQADRPHSDGHHRCTARHFVPGAHRHPLCRLCGAGHRTDCFWAT